MCLCVCDGLCMCVYVNVCEYVFACVVFVCVYESVYVYLIRTFRCRSRWSCCHWCICDRGGCKNHEEGFRSLRIMSVLVLLVHQCAFAGVRAYVLARACYACACVRVRVRKCAFLRVDVRTVAFVHGYQGVSSPQ